VFFDFWDWESDLIWTGRVAQVLQRLSKTPYVYPLAGALELDVGKIVEDFKLKPLLGISDDYQIASLTLMRSDGTTLYTTRDIAYTLQKFENADVVINVIGAEQTLAQLQLKAALFALGYGELALKHRHFSFGLVELPGFKMSSRRGRFITLDQVLDEAVRRAYDEVSKRSQGLTEGEKRNIAEVIGVGAVKYALVSVEPSKSVVFDWDKALNFETNSGPFIQYAHARACNILKKAEEKKIKIEKPNYELLKEPIERDLIILLARFPEVFLGASENLRPDDLAVYANTLADKFNSFYASLRVIQAESSELRDARLALVDAVRIVLRNAMSLLGIEMPKRM
jgi:arginyl-tRNA synthetase